MKPDRPLTGVDIDNALIQLSDVEDLLKDIRTRLSQIQAETRVKIVESIVCMSCDAGMGLTLAEALKAGWIELYYAEDLLQANFVGLCPECEAKEDAQVTATMKSIEPRAQPKGKLLF